MDLDYGYDDDGFENYVPQTTDPGPWLFVGTGVYSACCVLMIPILVAIKRKRQARRERKYGGVGITSSLPNSHHGSVIEEEEEEKKCEDVAVELRDEGVAIDLGEQKGRRAKDGRYSPVNEMEGVDSKLGEDPFQPETEAQQESTRDNNANVNATDETHSAREFSQQLEQARRQRCCAKIFGFTIPEVFVFLKDLVKYDKETKKILKLGIPFTISEVSEEFFWALTTLLVSRYTDVHQLTAYVVTNLLIGTSETIIRGFIETLETVISHAVGVGNNKLAGQYVQIVMIFYTIFAIPMFGMWWFVMEGALEWFELTESAVAIGTSYTKVVIFNYYLDGMFESFEAIPDVTDRETQTKIYDVTHEGLEFAVIWILLAKVEGFDLYWIGVLQLVSTAIGVLGFVTVTIKLGWFDPYWEGLTKSFALKNKSAVKYVVKMALPLSFGSLFEYGEWQVLTIFAASLGQAELAAWGLMESIWDLMEAFIEGFSDAGAVRLGLLLGYGMVPEAKRSAWKSLYLVTLLGLVITILYVFLGDYIAELYTSDETLQDMLKAMIPIVAYANVFQAFGSMSWGLLGGQGRYNHATIVSSIVTMAISIPLAAFFSLGMKFPLESLVSALVIGYATMSMCISYLLITSDWDYISKKVIEENEGSDSDDDSSSSDGSSSSSDDASNDGVELASTNNVANAEKDDSFSNGEIEAKFGKTENLIDSAVATSADGINETIENVTSPNSSSSIEGVLDVVEIGKTMETIVDTLSEDGGNETKVIEDATSASPLPSPSSNSDDGMEKAEQGAVVKSIADESLLDEGIRNEAKLVVVEDDTSSLGRVDGNTDTPAIGDVLRTNKESNPSDDTSSTASNWACGAADLGEVILESVSGRDSLCSKKITDRTTLDCSNENESTSQTHGNSNPSQVVTEGDRDPNAIIGSINSILNSAF